MREQAIDQRHLRSFELLARGGFVEEARLIYFWKTRTPPGARRPFDFELVRSDDEAIRQIAFKRPRVHRLAALLFDRAERDPAITCGSDADLFLELDARAGEQVFVGRGFALRDRPRAGVFLYEKRAAGMSEQQFQQCITDEKKIVALQEGIERTAREDNVTGTPTFIINGKEAGVGEVPLAKLDAAIQPLLKGGKKPAG